MQSVTICYGYSVKSVGLQVDKIKYYVTCGVVTCCDSSFGL
jgi:hypothetical protein